MRINRSVFLEVSEIDSINNWKFVLAHGNYCGFEECIAKLNLHKFAEGVKEITRKIEGKKLSKIGDLSSKNNKEGPLLFSI